MSYTVFMVAEKPSICTSVAQALYAMSNRSQGKLEARGRSPPVYEFEGHFQGRPATIRVTSVTGHVYSLDFPTKYQNWDTVDPLDLFSAPTQHNADGKGGMVKHLEREARGADALCLWMDCDREGENICFEVIRTVYHTMKNVPPARGSSVPSNIFRAKFSAVTQKDIEKAMQNLVSPNENEAKSVDARQELDLKVGVAFSRFQTRYFQGKYGNLDSAIVSYGPCQTPTLGFCVQRHDEIQSFVSESFWTVDVSVEVPASLSGAAKKVSLEWQRGRLFDQTVADTFAHILQQETDLYCYEVKTSETRRTKPQPLNTVELLKLASKQLGIGPQAAMRAAEYLYLSGCLSYPRTESTAYPQSFDIREALSIQRGHPEWGDFADHLLREGHAKPRDGHDAGDHPPITPVGLATDLFGDNQRIYELVARHFLATVSKDATYLQTKAKFRTMSPQTQKQEEFSVTGRREIDPGYLLVYGSSLSSRTEDCVDVPDFEKDRSYRISSISVRQGQTSAPGYLTESELIGLMEKHGIGTDASIPTHINNIMTRNYVTLGSGRTLLPTDLGVVLVHGYLRIDPDLVLPDVRAAIESFCDLIAKGTASKEQVVLHSLSNFEKKFVHFRNNIGAMDSLFEASFSPLAATGKPLSKCGKCLRYMRFIPLKPQRLYCPTCEETYSLPQNGTIKLYKELKCPLDNFDLVLFSLGNSEKAQGKSFPLCPCCYSFPPSFEDFDASENKRKQIESGELSTADHDEKLDNSNEEKGEEDEEDEEGVMAGHMGCNTCMHPSCKHSAVANGVCQCPGTTGSNNDPCSGTLVLDVNSKPNWKLACNQCNTLIRFKSEIHQITPQGRKDCPECGVKLLNFEFNKLKSPLPNGQTTLQGCIVCDDFLNGLTDIIAGRAINITVMRQMRHRRAMAGRGRGRGRGGRGRGRKNKSDILMSFSDF